MSKTSDTSDHQKIVFHEFPASMLLHFL